MKRFGSLVLFAISLVLLAETQFHATADNAIYTALKSVTPEILAPKIKEVNAAADLQEGDKKKLVELYRQDLSNSKSVEANTKRLPSFRMSPKLGLHRPF